MAAFNLAHRLKELYSGMLGPSKRKGIVGGFIAGIGYGFSQLSMLGGFGLAFYIGGLWVSDGSLTFDDLMMSLMSVMMSAMAVGESNSMAPDMAKAGEAIKSIFTMVDLKPDIQCDSPDGKKPTVCVLFLHDMCLGTVG